MQTHSHYPREGEGLMSGHSKGPWTWDYHHGMKDSEGNTVLVMGTGAPLGAVTAREDYAEIEANTYLTVAAPDMYDALREVAFQFGPLEEAKLLGTADVEALHIVRAALAKAEGR